MDREAEPLNAMKGPKNARVFVARHRRRRGAVAQAWAFLADARLDAARPSADILTTIDSRAQRRWTHPDTLSATLDALLCVGVEEVRVFGDAHRFAKLRYADETWGRPVRLIDNQLAATRRAEGDGVCTVILAVAGGPTLTETAIKVVGPWLCLVDGFSATLFGRGRHQPFIAAGTDPVAVDAVVARLLGRDPRRIEVLAHATAKGLGTLDALAIDVMPVLETLIVRGPEHSHAPHAAIRTRRVRAI